MNKKESFEQFNALSPEELENISGGDKIGQELFPTGLKLFLVDNKKSRHLI
ncbi:ComC/BlpC family leader-containing pheromone/bacteriocin [Streptococcus sanguinis]|uniref:ComC/BlpC family leader-containing pheromone/bacteriocin n=1 Tax=Streptococcus sanguinis TaxID=1305 RepID=A0A7H8UZS5_STRSA|nr:ComC/BlpC family leader-containing pheromone/bacteriocin [Streptococcus sanguinis]QLB49906.1 ComC/BlpC family leader-containing pheromone/bacteriocin [Streptococcus sanguinis]